MHTEMRNIMRNIPSIQMMDAMARGEARAEARILENIIKAVHEGKIPLKTAKDIDLDPPCSVRLVMRMSLDPVCGTATSIRSCIAAPSWSLSRVTCPRS